MDVLPDLQSDADVDALMARLAARLAGSGPQPAAPPAAAGPAPSSGDALVDLASAQELLAATIVRAMQVIAESLEEIHEDANPRLAAPGGPAPAHGRAPARRQTPSRGRRARARDTKR
jgi:hypothetical protein